MLDTPEATARFYVLMGYDRGQCVASLLRDFPRVDAEQLVSDALDDRARQEAQLDQQIAKEAHERQGT